jgi:integrase
MIPQFNFYLKDIHSTCATPIYLQAKFDYERLMVTAREKILPDHWDSNTKRAIVKYNRLEYPLINDWLDKMEMAAKDFYRNTKLQGEIPTAAAIKSFLEQKFNLNPKPKVEVIKAVEVTLMLFIDRFIEAERNNKLESTIKVYKTSKKHLANFANLQGKKDIRFDDINADFYDGYIQYLNGLNMAKNSVGKQIKVLKTFLNASVDRGINTNQFFKSKIFKKPTEEVDKAFLTDEEILKIYDLDLSGQGSIEVTRDLFIIACYTGFRFSDFTTLTKNHISENYITKKTLKTKTKVVIPIHPIVREILEKYNYELPKSITNAHANNQLKDICQLARINSEMEIIKTIGGKSNRKVYKKWELISTHSGRRSFATNAFLAGVPTISIMMITGHATESVFMQYISIDELANAEHIQSHAFFNRDNFIKAA